MTTKAPVAPAPHRPGLDVSMGASPGPVVSDQWTIAGRTVQFVRLDPHQSFTPDRTRGTVYVKVVCGRLVEPDRGAYAEPRAVRGTQVTGDHVTAGADGALFAVFTVPSATAPISSIDELRWSGPLDTALAWQTFESRSTNATPYFDGLDAHLSPGFHLLDADGAEIAYVFVWAAGKGVDMSTHNHGRAPGPTSPAFAEVHWVLANGTGRGGMYVTPEPGSPVRERTPVQAGEEHGPFFVFDPATGAPRRRDNGAVEYPWHSWEAGTDEHPGQAYDVVVAFEITAPYARVIP